MPAGTSRRAGSERVGPDRPVRPAVHGAEHGGGHQRRLCGGAGGGRRPPQALRGRNSGTLPSPPRWVAKYFPTCVYSCYNVLFCIDFSNNYRWPVKGMKPKVRHYHFFVYLKCWYLMFGGRCRSSELFIAFSYSIFCVAWWCRRTVVYRRACLELHWRDCSLG